jgi:hypothetical protein
LIAVIENYRLRLKNLEIIEMISKRINGMTSQLNLEYKEVKRSLILHPIENLSDLTSRLRRIDEISTPEEEASIRNLISHESVALTVPNRFKPHLSRPRPDKYDRSKRLTPSSSALSLLLPPLPLPLSLQLLQIPSPVIVVVAAIIWQRTAPQSGI